jgi:hypothetical protein
LLARESVSQSSRAFWASPRTPTSMNKYRWGRPSGLCATRDVRTFALILALGYHYHDHDITTGYEPDIHHYSILFLISHRHLLFMPPYEFPISIPASYIGFALIDLPYHTYAIQLTSPYTSTAYCAAVTLSSQTMSPVSVVA